MTMAPARIVAPGYRGLIAMCDLIGEPMEDHERRIARAHFAAEREVYAILPRGNLKTSLAAKIGLHHLLTVPGAAVTLGAASRDQARICFERMRGFAQHPALEDLLVVRHLELRHDDDDGTRFLRVVVSEGARVHGLSSSLYIGDEVWAWRGDDLLEAMLTGLIKRPDARFLGISTAAARLDCALGRARARAMAGEVKRRGPVIDATAVGLRWLEWGLPEDKALDDYRAVKSCNPAAYITETALREQAERVTPLAFAQFHCCRWGVGEGAWLPPGAWSACAAEYEIEPGERVWAAVDVGGTRSRTVCVWVTADLRVGVRIWAGDEAVLRVAEFVRHLAREQTVMEVAFDPWRFRSEALRLEADGLRVVEFPQNASRLAPASEKLYSAIIEKRLRHPNDAGLDRHIANCIARETPRGWRLDKATDTEPNDAGIALAMAVDRASQPPPPEPKFLGWL